MSTPSQAPLASLRVIECSLLGPGAIDTHLADLGADVIKVESPSGDYVREMTWPIIKGVSLFHLHIHRGKKSIVIDLRKEEGVQTFLDLVKTADVVVEAMRPGALANRGLGFDRLRAVNPRIVFCNISGYGMTGPYKDLPAHGIAFDTWAGLLNPAYEENGFPYIPEHASMGMHAGPLFGAFAILAGVIRARHTGEGCMMEIAQSDSAAYMDWYRSETWKAYERPQSEVTGNKADNYERRAPGTAGMKEGVRYQIYESSDGHVLFMASEQAFWKNFCEGVGRPELFEKWPGSKYADHARGNLELRAILRDIFKTKTSAEWIEFGSKHNTPLAPVNTPKTIADDVQFKARFKWYPHSSHGADMLPFPVKFINEELPDPSLSPTLGQHTDKILTEVLGYDADKIAALRKARVIN
ncbi:MAG: L-carnitine dehydratase/bile acid-inducible protein [Deltaproteobacteria bacterium]|jgi:crotonobetainyl-CoA:carnitine CoA-transferase CaiB-like acyl-CoA transferase|nr:L-carnitine dehydratase/bile acid-inducible protein [Deltaproteobacteria bacterium]